MRLEKHCEENGQLKEKKSKGSKIKDRANVNLNEIISEEVSESLGIDPNLLKDPANANDKVSENVLKCADYVIYEGEEVKVPSISSEVNIQVEEEGLLSIQIPCSTIVVAREESGTSCKEENTVQ